MSSILTDSTFASHMAEQSKGATSVGQEGIQIVGPMGGDLGIGTLQPGPMLWAEPDLFPIGVRINDESKAEMAAGQGTKSDHAKIDLSLVPYEAMHALAVVDGVMRHHTSGRLRFERLKMDAIGAMANVLTFGANKYTRDNWRNGMKWTRVAAAAKRHIMFGVMAGEENDPETGLHHLAHVMCCLAFLIWYEANAEMKANDDRFTKVVTYKDEQVVLLSRTMLEEHDDGLLNYILHQIMMWEIRDATDKHFKLSRLSMAFYATMRLLSRKLNAVKTS